MHRSPAHPLTVTGTRFRFGDFELDAAKRELSRGGRPVDIPARVFDCLVHLVLHRDRAVDRDELLQVVFGRVDVLDGQLAQIVLRARRAVGDDGREQLCLRTVPRYGYRWIADTEVLAAATAPQPQAADRAPPPSAPQPPVIAPARRWRRPRLRVALALGLVSIAAAALALIPRKPAPAAAQTVMVLPTRVDAPRDARWARLGVMDFVADRMRQTGLSVPPSESTLALIATDPEAHDFKASDHTRLRRAAGVDLIVESAATRADGAWRVTLTAAGVDRVRQQAQAADADLIAAAGLASDRLLARLGRIAPTGRSRTLALDERLQRVKAAMLANELDTARRILREAPAAQLAQPQLRYRLAQVDYRDGDYARARGTLDALMAGEAARGDALFRARLLIARGGALFRLDRLDLAERDFGDAVALLDDGRHDAELGQALNGRATARASRGDYKGGISDLGQARIHLLRAADAPAVARADANLGVIEMKRGRAAQAIEYLHQAAGFFQSAGAISELLVTRSALVAAYSLQLQHAEAEHLATRSWTLRERARDPGQRLALSLDRANALIALGRFREAQALLNDRAIAGFTSLPYERRRIQSRVELAWRRGDVREAGRLAQAALADWPVAVGDDVRDWVMLRREQAALAGGLEADLDSGAIPGPDSVPGLLGRAIAQRRRGNQAEADRGYRAAIALAERRGAPAEIVETALAYTPRLLERGRRDQAAALVGRVAPWAGRDFDCALLQLQLARALGDPAVAADALRATRALAGERGIAPGKPPSMASLRKP